MPLTCSVTVCTAAGAGAALLSGGRCCGAAALPGGGLRSGAAPFPQPARNTADQASAKPTYPRVNMRSPSTRLDALVPATGSLRRSRSLLTGKAFARAPVVRVEELAAP